MVQQLTHQVAVTGYVLYQDQFLLLKRTRPPLIYAPPGGRLHQHEDPTAGVRREVLEETGLRAEEVKLTDYWFGELGNYGPILSLDFLVPVTNQDVTLSPEHEAYCWANLADLRAGTPNLGTEPASFKVEHFEQAWGLR